jgi:hypothetical protein
VVLHGNETFFELPRSTEKGFTLEIEDAITVRTLPPLNKHLHSREQ